MNTQAPQTSKSSKMGSKSLTPRKVTPEAPRSVVNVGVDFQLLDEKAQEGPFKSCTNLPFADIDKMPQRSLLPRLDTDRNAVDLLRSLPPRKISLRKRTTTTVTPRPIVYENVLPTPAQESNNENDQLYLSTPKREEHAIKRRRLSPPALFDLYDTRETLLLPSRPEDVPSKLMLPSI